MQWQNPPFWHSIIWHAIMTWNDNMWTWRCFWYLVLVVIRWATSKFLRRYNGSYSTLRRSAFTWSVRHLCLFLWPCNWWTDNNPILSTWDTIWKICYNSNAFFQRILDIMWSGSIHGQQIHWFAFIYLFPIVTVNVCIVPLLEWIMKDTIKTA